MARPKSSARPRLDRLLARARELAEQVRQTAERVQDAAKEAHRLTEIARNQSEKGRELSKTGREEANALTKSLRWRIDTSGKSGTPQSRKDRS
jgi:methyl-accepting chemotaxis protein